MVHEKSVLEFLKNTKITGKGQPTIPKKFRDDLGLAKGARFVVLRIGDGLILLPAQYQFEQLCKRVRSKLAQADISLSEILSTLPAARERIHERYYGKVRIVRTPRNRGQKSRIK